MMTQDEFLERLWTEIVRDGSNGKWIDSTVRDARKTKNPAEGRLGALLKSMLDRGVTKAEIAELLEQDRRETVFGVIHMIEEDGLEPEAWEGIHEAFDGAEPGELEKPGAAKAGAGGSATTPRAGEPVLSIKQTHH